MRRHRVGAQYPGGMDLTQRFELLLSRPDGEVPLDEVALLIAAHAYPDLDVAAELGRLDELAKDVSEPTLDGVLALLFIDLRFVGNTRDYFDPRNSYLNDVVARRTGIPISLGVLTMVVGRRLGVPLVGVGMPGHFLLRDQVDQELYLDPFARGRRLDAEGCEAAFHAVHGAETEFDRTFLDPVSHASIVARMLANLRATFMNRDDRDALVWVLRLRTLVPGVPQEERAELASVLARAGRLREAADELDLLATQLGGELGETYRQSAGRLRAQLN